MPRKPSVKVKPVIWLSDEIVDKQAVSNSFQYYEKFQFKNIIAEINDFVLVSNADAAEPDTEEGCDAARILSLYEDSSNKHDPFRAKVQWYSKPADLPNSCLNKMDPISFLEKEVIEDHRPFDTHVSIETFFKKCAITLTFTKDTDINVTKNPYHYICRYRLMAMGKRKVYIEPVMEEERKAIELLCTPMKAVPTPNRTPKTPNSLVKRMSRVSIQEQKNWSVSKNDGTKLLLKRAILADKTEKDSPKKTPKPTPVHTPTDTPRSSKKLTNYNIEEALSMELRENSDDELPTLIIRQHVPTTPKRKPSISKNTDETPKKVLVFEEDEKEKYSTRSGRVIKNPISYIEEELSPVKRTPRAKSAINHMEEDTTPVKRTPRAASARAKSQIHYMEEDSSPVKQTPRKSVRKMVDQDDDDDFKPIPKTPRTPRTPRASKATPAKTPKRSVTRRIMTSELTPSLHRRAHSIETLDDYLKDNKSLPGRENQLDEILSFVRNKLLDGTSGCMYISGVPGTGKTATVCSALKILKDEDDLPDFQLVEVNGMRIAEPRQAYVQIYKQLTGKTVVWEQACSLLEKRFTNPGPRRTPTVLLVDELDALCTRRQDVLYSIMEWAAHSSALLTVLAVANTMDLPERALAARVASRLGLTRLSFAPYTHAQLQAIVASRLSGANVTADAVQLIASDFVLAVANTIDLSERALAARVASRLGLTRLSFAPYTHAQLQAIVASRLSGANVTADAVQLIARKVAAVSGDARRALALCGRALELAGSGTAGLVQVQRALEEAASGAAVRAVRNCCPAERLMLRAVAAEVERTGTDETTLSRALSTAAAIVALDGRPYRSAKAIRAPTPAQAHAICARLAAAKLLLLEPKPSEPRLLLNVSPDDVHYATRQITV